jgi:hypothetical protein
MGTGGGGGASGLIITSLSGGSSEISEKLVEVDWAGASSAIIGSTASFGGSNLGGSATADDMYGDSCSAASKLIAGSDAVDSIEGLDAGAAELGVELVPHPAAAAADAFGAGDDFA